MKSTIYNFISVLALSVLIIGCSENSIKEESIYGDEINVENFSKILALEYVLSDSLNNNMLFKTISSLSEIPTTRNELGDMRTVTKIYYGKKNGGITVPGFGGLKLGKKEANVNVYYIEAKVVNNDSDSIVYGIGYSMHYLFKKVKKGLSLSNIPVIAASAQIESSKTQVFYSLQTYGIRGINLVKYFKPTVNKNFDVEGFGVMQSSIDGIHNVLGDSTLSKSVTFRPRILKFVKPYELD